MSRRRSSVLLPFNATANRTGIHNSNIEHGTFLKNRKTPAKRRRTQVEVQQPEFDAESLEVCEDMKGKIWNVYRVSDLNNFSYTRRDTFGRYGRILSRFMVDSFTETAVNIKSTFTLRDNIQGFDGEDLPVHIKIEDTQFEKPKLIYEGFLLPTPDKQATKIEGTVKLPLLLARGSKTVRQKAHECLSTLFSSAIHDIAFPGEDMHWMIAAWAGFIKESKTTKEVEFLYAIPARTDTIKCTYSVNFIKHLWNCVHDQKTRIVDFVEVKRFHESLIKHTKQTIGLNLAAVPLVLYKAPDFELQTNGKVKIKNVDFIPRVLRFICDLCQSRTRENDLNSCLM